MDRDWTQIAKLAGQYGVTYPTNGRMDEFLTAVADAAPSEFTEGMSIRDYFAAQMLPRIGTGWPSIENRELLAKQAYQMADAMIAARKSAP
ncbi:hypothetical protein EVB56_039 [Rhizobium phage RHph_Y1_10]|nr:hypothetical protein EVB56_039 [Rhizobium phage RHph_Y1_10]